MARTAEQMLPSEAEMMGHYSVVHSPDDDGYYADMWWDNTLDSPVFLSPYAADDWAKEHGGVTRHRASR